MNVEKAKEKLQIVKRKVDAASRAIDDAISKCGKKNCNHNEVRKIVLLAQEELGNAMTYLVNFEWMASDEPQGF